MMEFKGEQLPTGQIILTPKTDSTSGCAGMVIIGIFLVLACCEKVHEWRADRAMEQDRQLQAEVVNYPVAFYREHTPEKEEVDIIKRMIENKEYNVVGQYHNPIAPEEEIVLIKPNQKYSNMQWIFFFQGNDNYHETPLGGPVVVDVFTTNLDSVKDCPLKPSMYIMSKDMRPQSYTEEVFYFYKNKLYVYNYHRCENGSTFCEALPTVKAKYDILKKQVLK